MEKWHNKASAALLQEKKTNETCFILKGKLFRTTIESQDFLS